MGAKRRGFTLIELIVVMIIIGILAAVSIPLMQGYAKRAIASEAVSALGTIRSAERVYYSQTNSYTSDLQVLGFRTSDLNGRFFSQACYSIASTPNTFTATCSTALSSNATVASWTSSNGGAGYISMDEGGNISSSISGLGYNP